MTTFLYDIHKHFYTHAIEQQWQTVYGIYPRLPGRAIMRQAIVLWTGLHPSIHGCTVLLEQTDGWMDGWIVPIKFNSH